MNELSESEITGKIETGEPFCARLENGAFEIKVDRYVPYVGTAIHHGQRIPESLKQRILLSEEDRRFEEDPFTGDFIDGMPITLTGCDSRYLYDLNRHPDQCIYYEAWGKKVWKRSFTEVESDEIRDVHSSYYRVLGRLISRLENMYSQIVLYDLHSYNYSRINGDPPLFNIGTHYIEEKYVPFLYDFKGDLQAIELPGVINRSVFDEVFQGKGYQAAFVRENHPKSLCIPLEIKKVFMSEHKLERYDDVYGELKRQLADVIASSAGKFEKQFINQKNR